MFQHHSYFSSEQIANFRNLIAKNCQNIELITSQLMLAMGFKMHLCGAKYIHEAIVLYYKLSDNTRVSFSKTIFPDIAQKYKSCVHNVDKDIRTAIKSCYCNGKMLAFNELCGCEIFSSQYQPTISELIVNIVTWIKTVVLENNFHSYER